MKTLKLQIDNKDVSEFEIQFTALVGREDCIKIVEERDFWTTVLIEIECEQEGLWAEQLQDELTDAV